MAEVAALLMGESPVFRLALDAVKLGNILEQRQRLMFIGIDGIEHVAAQMRLIP